MNNTNHKIEVIAWPSDWIQRSKTRKYFQFVPFWGDYSVLKKNVEKTLSKRTADCLQQWDSYKAPSIDIIEDVLKTIQEGSWSSYYFIPEDSLSLLCMDDDSGYDIINDICKRCGIGTKYKYFDSLIHDAIPRSLELVEDTAEKSLGSLVTKIIELKNC